MSRAELPAYRCHKEVRALKIADLKMVDEGIWVLTPADTAYTAFTVPFDYIHKHSPKPGGYYVVYEDGYTSYSPAAAFEAGYTLIDGAATDHVTRALEAAAAELKRQETADPALVVYPRPNPDGKPADAMLTCIDGDIDLAALVRAVLGAGG